MSTYNYRMEISYDGSRYSGWQKNKNADATIQTQLNTTLSRYFDETVDIIGAGRTDKGVHAECMTCNFHLTKSIDDKLALLELNQYLPTDISVLRLEAAPERFHARFHAVSKTYRYTFYKAYEGYKPVFDRNYTSLLDTPVNLSIMKEACQTLIGEHDFKAFCNDKTKKSTVRTLNNIQIQETPSQIIIEMNGDGFLYNMVRIIVGTLIEVGQKKKNIHDLENIFKSKQRSAAGYLVEAKGLSLVKVIYNDDENQL